MKRTFGEVDFYFGPGSKQNTDEFNDKYGVMFHEMLVAEGNNTEIVDFPKSVKDFAQSFMPDDVEVKLSEEGREVEFIKNGEFYGNLDVEAYADDEHYDDKLPDGTALVDFENLSWKDLERLSDMTKEIEKKEMLEMANANRNNISHQLDESLAPAEEENGLLRKTNEAQLE